MSGGTGEATAGPRNRTSRWGRLAGALVVVAAIGIGVAATQGGSAPRAAPPRPSAPGPSIQRPAPSDPSAAAYSPPATSTPLSPGQPVPSGQNQSDPVLYVFGGRYFLFTSGEPGPPAVNVPVASATRFTKWSPVADALPALPSWAVAGFTWAPDVHRFGSTYVLYFTALVQGSSPPMECIGDATGPAPDGPFTSEPNPFICQRDQGGSIDPRVFTDTSGANWMLWKSDQNIGGSTTPTKMWSQPLSADGLSLTGSAADIMQPDEAWQGSIVEAPQMLKVGGTYWVFYSGNWFNHDAYAIGAARCSGPAGPCADTSTVPLLGSNSQGQGPGEASVFEDQAGVWMLYSPWRSLAPKPDIPPRPVYITRLGFAPSGPYLAAGGPPPALDASTTLPFFVP